MKKCSEITIADYKALVDPSGLIIDTDPEIEKLCYKPIKEVFEKYKHRAIFKKQKEVSYPLIVSDDVYNKLASSNPAIMKLKEKFDCDIF